MPQIALGTPIPADRHAISVSLPTVGSIYDYENGVEETIKALRAGYPRFRFHDDVVTLTEKFARAAGPGCFGMVFPSSTAASKCIAFVGEGRVAQAPDGDVYIAVMPHGKEALAKAFWQHTGLGISSRRAENILSGRPAQSDTVAKYNIRKTVGLYADVRPKDVWLYPSGMAAIKAAHELLANGREDAAMIQLGMPYTDTLKVLEKWSKGTHIPYNSTQDLRDESTFVRRVRAGGIQAVFCEAQGNPLNRTIDLRRLSEILRPIGIPLVADDTLGAFNIDVKPFADIVVTSATKYLSGVGNVMAGVLTLNLRSPHYQTFSQRIAQSYEDSFYADDAVVLDENMRHFERRMREINANGSELAHFLKSHPAVESVFYPEFVDKENYEFLRNPGGGYGGLISFTLKKPERLAAVYDSLDVAKGPSLGSDFALACPYTLLAHWDELDWAESQGVSRHLLRVNAGRGPDVTEPYERALALAL